MLYVRHLRDLINVSLLSLACSLAAPALAHEKSIQRTFDAADRARAQKQTSEAEHLYLKACKQAQESDCRTALVDAHVRLADLYLHADDLIKARMHTREAIKVFKDGGVEPEAGVFLAELADAYSEVFTKRSIARKITRAIEIELLSAEIDIREAMQARPDQHARRSRFTLCRLYISSHQWGRAIDTIEPIAKQLQPHDPALFQYQVWKSAMRHKISPNRGDEAFIEDARALFEKRKDYPLGLLYLGDFYKSAREYKFAAQLYTEAANEYRRRGHNSDYALVERNLGYLFDEQHDFVNAEKHFREAMKAAKSSGGRGYTESAANLAAILEKTGRKAEARLLKSQLRAIKKERRMDELRWFTLTGDLRDWQNIRAQPKPNDAAAGDVR
ncbi:MAG TPA: tetratricopeptide repeat protein [Candidatus Obscuribacterales bacterium]